MNTRKERRLAEAQRLDLELNDAQLIQRIEENQKTPMKRLNKNRFPIRSISVKVQVKEVTDLNYLHKGQHVEIQHFDPFNSQPISGKIEAITADGQFVRLEGHNNGRRYPVTNILRVEPLNR